MIIRLTKDLDPTKIAQVRRLVEESKSKVTLDETDISRQGLLIGREGDSTCDIGIDDAISWLKTLSIDSVESDNMEASTDNTYNIKDPKFEIEFETIL